MSVPDNRAEVATDVKIRRGSLAQIREHPDICRGDVELILGHVERASLVLDLGCGEGTFLKISRSQLCAVGIDILPQAVQACRDNGLTACLADGFHLPFRSGMFDVIRAKDILEHLADPLPMVRECRRVLKNEGLFIVHVPSVLSIFYPVANFYDDYTHYRPFTRNALRRLLEDAGFTVLFIKGQVSGRNALERAITSVLGKILPKRWLTLAQRLD